MRTGGGGKVVRASRPALRTLVGWDSVPTVKPTKNRSGQSPNLRRNESVRKSGCPHFANSTMLCIREAGTQPALFTNPVRLQTRPTKKPEFGPALRIVRGVTVVGQVCNLCGQDAILSYKLDTHFASEANQEPTRATKPRSDTPVQNALNRMAFRPATRKSAEV
jgi:hypothetical protein